MPVEVPFEPIVGGTVQVQAVSTSASGSASIVAPAGGATTIMVTNTASVTLFVRLDKSSATLASSVDVPMLPTTSKLFTNPQFAGTTIVSVAATVNGSGTSSFVYFTPGNAGVA